MEVGLWPLSLGGEWGKNKFWLGSAYFGWTLILPVSWEKKSRIQYCTPQARNVSNTCVNVQYRNLVHWARKVARLCRKIMTLYKGMIPEIVSVFTQDIWEFPAKNESFLQWILGFCLAPLSSLEYSYCTHSCGIYFYFPSRIKFFFFRGGEIQNLTLKISKKWNSKIRILIFACPHVRASAVRGQKN